MANKNTTQEIASSDVQDAIRRAAKARRDANRKAGKSAHTTLKGTYFGDLMDEKARLRKEREARRERQLRVVHPADLAIKATEAPCLVGLNGLVLSMVVATIDQFATIEPQAGKGRLATAFEAAKAELPEEDGRRHKAHGVAYGKVRTALDWARTEILNERGVADAI